MKIERIVVAVDGSDGSARALTWATALAEAVGAEVIAVHALGLLDADPAGNPIPTQGHRDEIRRRFETEWCAPLDGRDVRCRRLLQDGPAVSVLLAVAESEDADLIVLGSRGLGGYPEQLLGSTSTQVAQTSHVPVTIIPS